MKAVLLLFVVLFSSCNSYVESESEERRTYIHKPSEEHLRTNPDYVVYLPEGQGDGDNEHLLVFNSPNNDLLALWTQSSVESFGDNRIVLSRSIDHGQIWSLPKKLAGLNPGENGRKIGGQASWAFPVISSNRIYIFYNRQTLKWDNDSQHTGFMGCIWSDDNGLTFSKSEDVPMKRNKYDYPERPDVPKHWVAWQKPILDQSGKPVVGYTQWVSPVHHSDNIKEYLRRWWAYEARSYLMRFENLNENPNCKDIIISWLPDDEQGLEVQHPNFEWSTAEEPSVVLLPNGELFVVMRTYTGYLYYSISRDNGHTFDVPQKLRYSDNGAYVTQPRAPAPLFKLNDGRFLLVFHNNDGKIGSYDQSLKEWKINHLNYLRNPAFISVGYYNPSSSQLLEFSRPKEILNTLGIAFGPKNTQEIATYPSLTEFKNKRILWYPDRKHFLLGLEIKDSWLADMTVQGK